MLGDHRRGFLEGCMMKLIGSGMNNVFEFQAKRNQHVEGNNRTYQNWNQEMHQSECSTPPLCYEVLKQHMEVNGLFLQGIHVQIIL